MRYLQLEPLVGYGLVGDRAVFLDLRRDRYFSLDPSCEHAFQELREAPEPVLSAGPHREALLATGLFRASALRVRLAAADPARPTLSLLDETARAGLRLRAAWRAWRAVKRARRRLTTVPIAQIARDIREARYAVPPQGDASVAEDAARSFVGARAIVPVERGCLLDSLALIDWLGEDAGHAQLVFGVSLDPFRAHCWLQTERLLLTDAHDTVGTFVPVLSV
ncbi:MAG: hypothetical protein B7Z33_03210 [Sphingomonadales bacterium 12-68-11]|nr:MAG: hypothetical protein B7Z33_03210 [Sphingomonadales bacterium 12-68-11]OYX16871.1 MAG: hypothetical protein B7Z07_01660 [Sphingomonadales bacterium 32-67-7]